MILKYKKIWKEALPYLKKGSLKNFIIHTEGVVRAMEMILKKEKGDKDILIPAAILHDVGWANVSKKFQDKSSWSSKINLRKAMELHLKYAPPIIKKILESLKFKQKDIFLVTDIVKDHKFKNPRNINKRILIDADNLSDVFKKQFWTNVEEYNVSPKEQYEFRKVNKFYTKTAQDIFIRELNNRKKEVGF